ncbi:MAG: OmpA family protein [Myxococcales bacterium]
MASRVTKHASPLLLQRGVRGVSGQSLDIVLHVPVAPALSAAGFEFDSAFPGAALLGTMSDFAHEAMQRPEARLMVFGHADEAGDEGYNKKLGDRRARSVLALLTQDLDAFDAVADDDKWDLIHYQAIMVALGITPMDVDGKPGPKTTKGTKAFQVAYNAGDYHAHAVRERAHDKLQADGKLGPKTYAALRDAYLAMVDAQIDPARFIGPKFAGCGEFNRIGSPEQDRRVVLAMYRPDFPTESKIPCKEGDAGGCKLNRDAQHTWKCNFYRRTLESEVPLAGKPLPARVKILVQTVDELGYRLGSQALVFIDGTGAESPVATDEKGVFNGFITVSGPKLSVRLPNGATRDIWDAPVGEPAVIDLVITGTLEDAALDERRVLESFYGRTPAQLRAEGGRTITADLFGEGWLTTSDRGANS